MSLACLVLAALWPTVLTIDKSQHPELSPNSIAFRVTSGLLHPSRQAQFKSSQAEVRLQKSVGVAFRTAVRSYQDGFGGRHRAFRKVLYNALHYTSLG